MNKKSNYLWGILFIGLGIIFGLNALDITNIDIFFDGWWTLFIIIPSFIGLFNDNDKDKGGNLIGLFIGVFLLFGCLDIISFDIIWSLMFPAILVGIGISFMFKGNDRRKVKIKSASEEYNAIFGKQDIVLDKEKFTGCEVNAIFGNIKLDLRKAIIKDDVIIEATSVFGSVTIILPDDVSTKVSAIPIFGGVNNTTRKKDNSKTVYINATAMFGGVDIND